LSGRVLPVLRRLLGAFALFLCVSALAGSIAAVALAAEAPYGEVTRFGGFDPTGLSSPPAHERGKFFEPVGFAVEPENSAKTEKNAVYVLDRTTSEPGAGVQGYRLQKYSSTGTPEVLGSTTISETYTDKTNYSDIHPLVGLAVDPEAKRVYAIVETMVLSESTTYVPVAAKLVAWSTEPVNKELVRASATEFPVEDPITKASVVAGEPVLKSAKASEALYAPEGLVVDQASHDVVIDAQYGVTGRAPEEEGGPIDLQRVHTTGSGKGTLGANWLGEAPKFNAFGMEGMPVGLFAPTDGSGKFGVDIYTQVSKYPRLATVGSEANGKFTTSAPLDPDGSAGKNWDEAPTVELEETPNHADFNGGSGALSKYTAGSPIVQLEGNHLYAAVFADPTGGPGIDEQGERMSPWNAGVSPNYFWVRGGESTKQIGNIGIRLFEADGRVIDTIGGGAPNSGTATVSPMLGSCNINLRRATVAAGAEGAVFVLTSNQYPTNVVPQVPDAGDEVVEFAPGGQHPCPSIGNGAIEIENKGKYEPLQTKQGQAAPSVTVGTGVKAKFSGLSLDGSRGLTWNFSAYKEEWNHVFEWTPFAFEWNFEGKSTGGPGNDGYTVVSKIEGPTNWMWPSPEAEYEYKTPGIYNASLRVYGDYGTKVFPFTVHVPGSEPPKAEFTVPATITAGKAVVFDASASKPTTGTEVEDYEWSFGDGTAVVHTGTQATVEHTFAATGKYTVKLTIHDTAGTQMEASMLHEATVAAAPVEEKQPPQGGGGGGGGTGGPSGQTSTQTGSGTGSQTATTTAKPLTRAQKLTKALKACHKLKSKKARTACVRRAKRKYASKPVRKSGKKSSWRT
jgi:PKD repeat protein